MTLSKLELQPGMSYRPVLKFCAEGHCFPVVYGNGVTVVVNPPKTGNMTVVIEGDQVNSYKSMPGYYYSYYYFVVVTMNRLHCMFKKS